MPANIKEQLVSLSEHLGCEGYPFEAREVLAAVEEIKRLEKEVMDLRSRLRWVAEQSNEYYIRQACERTLESHRPKAV